MAADGDRAAVTPLGMNIGSAAVGTMTFLGERQQ